MIFLVSFLIKSPLLTQHCDEYTCSFLLIAGGWSSEASTHIIGIMPSQDIDTVELIISTQQSSSVHFTISNATGSIANDTVSADSPTTISIDTSFAVDGIGDRSKGILLTTGSTDKLSVVVAIISGSVSSGTYHNLPPWGYSVNQYTYYAVSADTTNSNAFSAILIVGANSNTSILINATQDIVIPADLTSNGTQVTLVAGSTITVTLNYCETLLLKSDADLTGSKVISNKPISFYSGHTGANIPTNKFAWDFIGEQFPPTVAWGNSFLVGSFINRDRFILKAITSQNNSSINIICSDDVYISNNVADAGMSVSATILPGSSDNHYCSVVADSPILVVQFGLGQGDDFNNGDPYSIYVPPTHQYYTLQSYTLSIPEISAHARYFNLAVLSNNFNSSTILLDNAPVDTWNEVPSINGTTIGYIAQVTASTNTYNITFDDANTRFNVILYALGSIRGHGHVDGLNLLPYGECIQLLQYILNYPNTLVFR